MKTEGKYQMKDKLACENPLLNHFHSSLDQLILILQRRAYYMNNQIEVHRWNTYLKNDAAYLNPPLDD